MTTLFQEPGLNELQIEIDTKRTANRGGSKEVVRARVTRFNPVAQGYEYTTADWAVDMVKRMYASHALPKRSWDTEDWHRSYVAGCNIVEDDVIELTIKTPSTD